MRCSSSGRLPRSSGGARGDGGLGLRVQDLSSLGQGLDRPWHLGPAPPRALAHRQEGQLPPPDPEDRPNSVIRGAERRPLREAGLGLRADRACLPARLEARALCSWSNEERLDLLGTRSRRHDRALLTAKEVAELLAVPESWVRGATREGRLPTSRSVAIAATRERRSKLGSPRSSRAPLLGDLHSARIRACDDDMPSREPKWGRVWRYEGPRGVVWRIRYKDASGKRVLETLGKEPPWNRKRSETELRRRLVDVERDGYGHRRRSASRSSQSAG